MGWLRRRRQSRPAVPTTGHLTVVEIPTEGILTPSYRSVILLVAIDSKEDYLIEAAPEPLRPAVQAFCASLLHSPERARRVGTLPRAGGTISPCWPESGTPRSS